jgi:hypothetical protein
MDSPAFEPLEWDDQEEVTIPSRAKPAPAAVRKSSKRGWLVITNEHPVTTVPESDAPQRDTHVELTERDTAVRWQPTTAVEMPLPLLSPSFTARSSFATPRPSLASIAPATIEVAQLRRWLIVSLLLSTVAAVLAATAVIVSFANNETHARYVATSLGAAQRERLEADAATPVIAAAPVAPAKVKLTITLLDSWANVRLARDGETPQTLSGPWPLALELEPGRYTVTAFGSDFTYFQRVLDLAADRPEREVMIRLQ